MKREEEVNRLWNKFKNIFGYVVAAVIALRFIVITYKLNTDIETYLFFAGIDLLLKLFMVYHVGRYAYLISGKKKKYWLYGILGFIWIGIITIGISYLTMRSLKDSELKKLGLVKIKK